MRKQVGLTRIDVAVALACIALVLAQAGVINAGGRERSKREVCLANLRSLAAAWQTYSNDNSGKVPCGDVWYSWSMLCSSGVMGLPAWHEWPHTWPHGPAPSCVTGSRAIMQASLPNPKIADWRHAIAEGTMWRWVNDYKVYKCPVGEKGQEVTYAMSHAMNTFPGSAGPGSVPRTIKLRGDIRRAAERYVFLDAGSAKQGAFFLRYDGDAGSPPAARGSFGDHAPCRHGHGTTFVFADQHVEYHKWVDGPPGPPVSSVAYDDPMTWGGTNTNLCYCDWRWFCKVTWGDVPTCTIAGKKCDY